MVRGLTPKERELNDVGSDLWDELNAILAAFLPADVFAQCREIVSDLQLNSFSHCFEGDRLLYTALVRLLPDNRTEIRAAYQETVLSGCEEDWEPYETPSAPNLRLVRHE